MSFPLSGLNAAYTLGGSNLLALLEMGSISIDVDSVDAAGLGDTDEYQLPVKRGAKHDFSVRQLNGSGIKQTNLDISLWSIDGTDFLGAWKSGGFSGSVRTKDTSGGAQFDKKPAFRRRAMEFTTDKMVFSTSVVGAMISRTPAQLSVAVSITFGASTYTQQMLLTAGKITVQGEDTTMENLTLKNQGTATSPSDSTLLGVFLGNAQLALVLQTCAAGGEQFETSGSVLGLLTRLNGAFSEGALTKLDGTLEIQGALTYVTT